LALAPTPLLGAVALDRLGLIGTVVLPAAGMRGAPHASAVATALCVVRMIGELVLASLGAASILTGGGGAGKLRRVETGWCKLLLAETAAPDYVTGENAVVSRRRRRQTVIILCAQGAAQAQRAIACNGRRH